MATSLIQLLLGAVAFGTVIMFGCIGEIITEKAGNLNLGVPGIMSPDLKSDNVITVTEFAPDV